MNIFIHIAHVPMYNTQTQSYVHIDGGQLVTIFPDDVSAEETICTCLSTVNDTARGVPVDLHCLRRTCNKLF
jgi:hypothetical protein